MARSGATAPHANRHWPAIITFAPPDTRHWMAEGRARPAFTYWQDAGQFFADAKWRKTGKFPTNQRPSVLKSRAGGLIFVQCTRAD
jgi:hypothetical protein